MLARLPDVDALLARALALDEAWEEGALHEFTVVLAGAGGGFDVEAIPRLREHFDRALELSQGKRAGLFVTWAESVSVPTQNAGEFREMLRRALTIDPDEHEANRLMNLVSQRRADWLLGRVEDLFLDPEGTGQVGEGRR